MITRVTAWAFTGFSALSIHACASDRSCVDDGSCPPSSDGGPNTAVPDGCDQDADAHAPDAKGCVVDSFALFVDGYLGFETAEGTRAKPLRSLSSAIAKVASTGKRRVYVCGSASFGEHLVVTTAVSIFGGFKCGSWDVDADAKPKVAPVDKGYALHVDGVPSPIVVSDLELSSPDMSSLKDGSSSIAVFVNHSNVTFRRTAIHASNGAEGEPGAPGEDGKITSVSSGSLDATGNPGSNDNGGAAKTCTCSSTLTTTGGRGGPAGLGGGNGEPSYMAPPPKNGAPGLGAGGSCGVEHLGKEGADAPDAQDAAPPAALGQLDADGWTSARGADATENGKPGQGGGGGGAINGTTGASGGGCGGCGGLAGKGSGGGGASVALLAHNAVVALVATEVLAAAGGSGGVAGRGGTGKAGGIPGAAGLCSGGTGGKGADGGAGAGGAGGVSVGVLYKGAAPSLDEATSIAIGKRGNGGTGGKPGVNDGPPGIAEPVKDASQL